MLRVGTVGTSSIMRTIQEAIRLTDGMECRVVYSRTEEQGRAFAHAKQGWETFTKAALEYAVQQSNAPLAAVLWGKPAQKYAPVFAAVQDRRPVLVLESAHPSPLSAYRGFFGSAPFGKINAFLQQHGEAAIDWLK